MFAEEYVPVDPARPHTQHMNPNSNERETEIKNEVIEFLIQHHLLGKLAARTYGRLFHIRVCFRGECRGARRC
jgi:hypothetical protein